MHEMLKYFFIGFLAGLTLQAIVWLAAIANIL